MNKINIENEQLIVKRLIKKIENESNSEARAILNTIKKSAYNRQYNLKNKLKNKKLTNIEYSVIQKQYESALAEYSKVSEEVENIRRGLSKKSINKSVSTSLNRLNIFIAKTEARKSKLREIQKQSGTVIGVSLVNLYVNNKTNAIIQNYVLNSKGASFSDSEYLYINQTLKKLFNYDFEKELISGFASAPSYSSDELFESIIEIVTDIEVLVIGRATELNEEEKNELQNVIDIFRSKGII